MEKAQNKLFKAFGLLDDAHYYEYENHVQILHSFINTFSKGLCNMLTDEIKIDKQNRKKKKETFEVQDN